MSKAITHSGIVRGVESRNIVVSVSSSDGSGCSGCGIAPLCSSKNSTTIVVPVDDASAYAEGDEVVVEASVRVQWLAIAMCLVLPTVVIMVVAAGVHLSGRPDSDVALWCLVAVTVYFLVLWFFRGRMAPSVGWRVARR